MLFYDENDPLRGAVAVSQGAMTTAISEADFAALRESLIEAVPIANWDGFNGAILSNTAFNQRYGVVLQAAPAIAAGLPTALAQVATNGTAAFQLVFGAFCQVGDVSAEERGEWADMAESFDLPSDFVAIVRGE